MTEERNLNEMRLIRRQKLDELIAQGQNPHVIEKFEDALYSKDIKDNFEDFEEKSVRVAGRIMTKRGHGKINFMDLQDMKGRIQLFNKQDLLGAEVYDQVKKLDIGDIVGVEGTVFRTKAGEISVRSSKITLLTKSLQLLPDKWSGLKDMDLRYRQRYVDLIVNPDVKEVFFKRSQIISAIRAFLEKRNYLEVETSVLNNISGGASARPFITRHNALSIDMYLRIALELNLKRLIVGGFDRVYEIGRVFRNEGMDHTHNPEYTLLELYQAYTDLDGMMELTENMFAEVSQKVNGTQVINYQGTEIDLTPPWRRISMIDCIKEASGIDFNTIETDQEAQALAKEHNIELEHGKTSRGHIIAEFFDLYGEDTLIQPTFIYDYPIEISPLAKKKPGDPRLTRRFEAFINGSEMGNAFSELNDARDQYERFQAQVAEREAGDEEAQMMDEDFVNALEVGMPPTGGLGIGIDRMVMLLTDQISIRDVLLFPTMKPLGGQGGDKETADDQEDLKIVEPASFEAPQIDLSKVKIEPLFEDMVDFETFSKSDFRVVKVINCEDVPKSKKLLKFTLDDGSGTERTILSGIKDYYRAEDLIGKTLVAITNLPERKMMGIPSQGMIISAVYEYDGEEGLDLIVLADHIPAGAKLY